MRNTLKSIAFAGLLGLVGCSPNKSEQGTKLDQVYNVTFPDATSLVIFDTDGDGNVDYVKSRVGRNNETNYIRLGYKPTERDNFTRPAKMTPFQLRASQDLYEQVKIANTAFRVTDDKQ